MDGEESWEKRVSGDRETGIRLMRSKYKEGGEVRLRKERGMRLEKKAGRRE